jgi:putative transposase
LPLRILNVVDAFTRRCLGCRIDRSLSARDVAAFLGELFAKHGRPRLLRSDNGREFIAATLAEWLKAQRVEQAFIEKGMPQQNAFVERVNGTMRDEILNGETFHSVLEARVVIDRWVEELAATELPPRSRTARRSS